MLHDRFHDRPVDRRSVTRTAALAAALLATGAATTRAAHARPGRGSARTGDLGGLILRLPTPTGPYRIGVTTLHLVDRDRPDPWDSALGFREVMATVFYAARTGPGHPRAPQMTEGAAQWFAAIDTVHVHPQLPKSGVNWAATLTHAHAGAPAIPVRRPVLLHSPGAGDPRTLGTGLAEELASHGHVVVSVDHPGETSEVEFPDGRVRCLQGPPGTDGAFFRKMIDIRLADVRFVLDRLREVAAGRNPDASGRALPAHLGRALDLRRVGMYGHSAGGTTVAQALYEIPGIGAAVNMEGYLDTPSGELLPVARDGVDRPLLLLGTDGFRDDRIDRSWSVMLAHPGGRTHRRQLDDAMHWVFTDYGVMAPRLRTAGLMTAAQRDALVGAVAPAESVRWVRGQVRAFFARHLPPR